MKSKRDIQFQRVKKAVSCAAFLLLTAAIFVLLTYIFRPVRRGGRRNITSYYNEQKNTLDVVAVGASGTYRFYDPMVAWEEQGITSYAYAAASMQASSYITALRDVMRTQSPKLVIVDARRFTTRDMETRISPRYQNYMDSIDVGLDRLRGVRYFSQLHGISLKESIVSYLDLIQYHDNYYALWQKSHLKYLLNRAKTPLTCYKGYLIAHGVRRQKMFDGWEEAAGREIEPGETARKIFTDLLDYCREQGIEILLTVSPCDYDAETMMELNAFERIAGEYGVPFLNANSHAIYEEMGLDFSTDFYNHTHMNISGAEKYTRYLAGYLKEHYELPDHRGDAAYAAWDRQLAYYKERAQRAYDLLADKLAGGGDEDVGEEGQTEEDAFL